jgi:hypothetical protein
MRWFRALIICCCLLALLTGRVNAAPSSQSIDCDAGAIASQFPWLRDWLAYLSVPYAQQLLITVEGQSLTIQICAPQTQSITANHLLDVMVKALPKLSYYTGVPLGGGGFQRPMLLVADDALPFANGAFDENGIIYLRNAIPDRTIVHEGAHYWANEQNFRDLWMIEGYADYLTELVTNKPRATALPSSACEDVVLLYWQYQPHATAECGYVAGAAVFRDLAAQIGAEPFRDALRGLRAHIGPIDSWWLLTGLEESICQDLTPIFLQHHVFPPEYELDRRAQQRSKLCQQQQLAEALKIMLPGQVEHNINARAYDAADRWLSRLPAFLKNAGTVAHSCDTLKLACDRPWQRLPQDDPAALEPITARLIAAQPLLDEYRALREAAQALGLTPPVGLAQAVAALDPIVQGQIRQARATLEHGRALEQQCRTLAAPCRPGWREQWSDGNIALATGNIVSQTEVLSQSVQVEARCDLILDACHTVWHPYLAAGQFVEAHTALSKLGQLLDMAVKVEQSCGDMVMICRDSWQATLRAQQLPGLELRLAAIDKMLMRTQAVDKICKDWNCAQAWRTVFRKSGDPRLVQSFLDEAQRALPTLQRAAAITGHTRRDAPSPMWPLTGANAQTLIEQAHQAFEQGDATRARALADQSLAAAAAPRLNWRVVAMPGGIILAVMLLVGVFVVARPRKPLRARRAVADLALLNELLSRPPETGKQQTTNVKKPHKSEAVAAAGGAQAADDERKKAA